MEDVEYVLVVEDEDVRRIYSFPVVSDEREEKRKGE
jgi:hypothetical protein